jgi:hypothetical protein
MTLVDSWKIVESNVKVNIGVFSNMRQEITHQQST